MIPEHILLEHLWDNYYGLPDEVHSLSRWLPFYMHSRQELLQEYERDRVYSYIVPGIINKAEVKHFKLRQVGTSRGTARHEDTFNYHHERILMFFEWVQCFPFVIWDKNRHKEDIIVRAHRDTEMYTGLIIYRYNKLFPRLEAILQWRRLGVGLPEYNTKGDPMILTRLATHWLIDYIIHFQIWKRDHPSIDLETFYMRRMKKVPNEKAMSNFRRRMQYVENLIVYSGGLNDCRIVGLTDTIANSEQEQELELL